MCGGSSDRKLACDMAFAGWPHPLLSPGGRVLRISFFVLKRLLAYIESRKLCRGRAGETLVLYYHQH